MLAPLVDALRGTGDVLLTGPIGPDGDSLGGCLALQRVLSRLGVRSTVSGEAGYRYAWMPGADRLLSDDEVARSPWDAVVVVDGDRHRLPKAASRAFERASVRGIVDHHRSTHNDGYTHYWVEPERSSACEMLYRAFVGHRHPIDADTASLLYAGLIFDTGGFRYSNTTEDVFSMAADLVRCGAAPQPITTSVLTDRQFTALSAAAIVYGRAVRFGDDRAVLSHIGFAEQSTLADGDLEGLVESLVQVRGTEVGVLGIQQSPDRMKLSLRSREWVDVAAIARQLHPSGGGHARAAGVVVEGDWAGVQGQLRTLVQAALSDELTAATDGYNG